MALSSRVQSIMAGVACGRSARQRREMDVGTKLAVSFFFSPEPWPHHMMLPTFRVRLFPSTKQI